MKLRYALAMTALSSTAVGMVVSHAPKASRLFTWLR